MAGSVARGVVPAGQEHDAARRDHQREEAGQLTIPLASDPLGWGWDLFGTALYRLDLGIVGARFVWYTAVGAIVTGHAVAVCLGHLTALALFGDAASARRSQGPILVLMLGYTALSLWILAQPVVES